jgi:CBS domain-containing protein
MKQRESIKKIMITDVATVNPSQKLSEVYELMNEKHVHHVPVVEGERLVGFLSSIDLMRYSYGNVYAQDERTFKQSLDLTSIREAMSEDLMTLSVDDYIKDAVEKLGRGDIHALPVIDGEKLAGIVTSTDIIKYLSEQY